MRERVERVRYERTLTQMGEQTRRISQTPSQFSLPEEVKKFTLFYSKKVPAQHRTLLQGVHKLMVITHRTLYSMC